MKKKFRFLSILSAAVIGASMCFTGCTKNGVAEHEHEYDDGEITTPSTCHSEGVRTYTCTVPGCKQTKTSPVAMIAHSWDNGKITKDPKCNEEGEKTYTCTSDGCNRTKTEPVEKTDHHWDDGVVIKTSDFLTKGSKKFTCLDCGDEKSESLIAHADFTEQYNSSASEQSDWTYGYASRFDLAANEIEFVPIEQAENGSWKSEGVEIGRGYVYSENHAIISYAFSGTLPMKTQADVEISFKGEERATALNAHLMITNDVGELVDTVELNSEASKDWSYKTQDAVDVAQGYAFWLVFENVGTGNAGGELTFTITAPCVHVWNSGTVTEKATCTKEGTFEYVCLACDEKVTEQIDKVPHEYDYDNGKVTKEATETEDGEIEYQCKNCDDKITEVIPKLGSSEFNGASFKDDFELNDDGEFNGWSVGVVKYNFGPETFDFTKITEHSAEAYTDNSDGWKEIKGDWMAVNGMMGFAYHFDSAITVNLDFKLNSLSENGKFALRWAVKDENGNIKNTDGKAEWGTDGHDIAFNKNISVEKGDVLYLLVGKDGDGDQSKFEITLTKVIPEIFEKLADFTQDFELNENGEFNGWTIGVVNFNFGPDTFEFNKISDFNEAQDAYHSNDPWIDVKGNWMASKSMVGIAYTFGQATDVTFNLTVNSKDDAECAIRWAVKDSAGNIKTNDGKATWGGSGNSVTLSERITVEEGDVLYILIGHEKGDNDQKDFTLTLDKKVS